MELATGYWASAVLLASNSLNLFGALAERPLSAQDVAQRLQIDPRAAAMLLDACSALRMVVKETSDGPSAVYRNAQEADAYLVPGRPGYLGEAIRWSADQYLSWGKLADSVRSGRPASLPELHLGADIEQTRHFVLGMYQRAMGVARGVVPYLKLDGRTHLLDIGGGPGAYAALLAERFPSLEVDVLDLPAIVDVARELASQSGAASRIKFRAGDAVSEQYGMEEYDAALFSGVLHQMSPETVREMFRQAYTALIPGGIVIVSDMMLGPDKTSPPFSALFSLQMLLTSNEGAVFSAEECLLWLRETGFVEEASTALPPPLPYTVVSARKP